MENDYKRNIDKKEISISYLIISIISWIITVVWMIEIFRLSSETGEISGIRSQYIVDLIKNLVNIEFVGQTFVRKAAHVFEYAILSLLIFLSIKFTNRILQNVEQEFSILVVKSENEMNILISLWLSFLFSILDEYHQLFVIGRSGSIIDVCIDGIGIVLVLLIIRLIHSIQEFHLKKHF